MSRTYQRTITISAGEECTISGVAEVRVRLLSGVVEVAGALVPAKEEPAHFSLSGSTSTTSNNSTNSNSGLILYTLEGGVVQVMAEAPFEATTTTTGVAPLVQLCRSTLAPARHTRVLVMGRRRSGKTLTAHTICNLLRDETTVEVTGGRRPAVFLMDLNAESNCLFAPGCISTVQVEHVMWPGTTSAPTLLPFSLFIGEASLPSSESIIAFQYFVEQLHECTEALIKEANHEPTHLVIDAPAPMSGIREDVYFRRLIELLKPTHVVTVGAQDGSETWATFLQEDVQRVVPDCDFTCAAPVTKKCLVSHRELRLREYFAGTPQYPLSCAKVVLPITQLQFVQYEIHDKDVRCCKVVPTAASLDGCVCALSHAELMEEVPLAPVAGLIIIVAIDEEHGELVAIIPTCENLPRRFIILPNKTKATSTSQEESEETTQLPMVSTLNVAAIMAQIEEAVAV